MGGDSFEARDRLIAKLRREVASLKERLHRSATVCLGARSYCDKYDADYCSYCNEWLEEKCSDKTCWLCTKRPERPGDADEASHIDLEMTGVRAHADRQEKPRRGR